MLYLEDFAPGQRYVSGKLRVDAAAIKSSKCARPRTGLARAP